VLDLARPYAGPGLKPWQWAAGLALLAVMTPWRGGRAALREAAPAVALAAFLLPTYVSHSRDLESDGIHYYAYLRSLLFDRDLDLRNDYVLLGFDRPALRNPLPVGAPLLWSPLVLPVHLARSAARLAGLGPPSGVEPLYQGAACLATLGYGAAGLFLLMGALRRWGLAAAAFWATVICWIGSPLRFYLSVLPGLAHGAEFFAAVLVLRAYLALRDRPDARRAAWAGAACALLFLVRSQDGVLLALPAGELLFRLRAVPQRRTIGRALLALAGAFALGILPQLAVWQAMFGTPILIPHKALHGAEFMHLDQPQLAGTLFSERGGLFVTHPAMLLAVIGLLPLARRDARYVLLALPPLLAGWYVNATVFDWYHVRRFTGAVPFLAPGLVAALAPLARLGPGAMALAALVFLRYDLAVDTLRPLPGAPVPVRAAVGEMTDSVLRDAYRVLEPPAPKAAVALLSALTREPAIGEGTGVIDLAGEPAVLRLPAKARNFSEVTVEDGVACRWIRDQDARLFLPVARSSPLELVVRARALETLEPQAMELVWNERPLGRQPMTASWADYRFAVPADAVHAGTNVLVFRFDRAPIYHRVRGTGPREPRPAAVASVTLRPV
jgi:hypothetical protein